MDTIGKIIKEERTIRNWTQTYLAEQINVTQDSISLWEKDKRIPDTQYIIELCKLFKISADYLLCIENTEPLRITNIKKKTININQTINIE